MQLKYAEDIGSPSFKGNFFPVDKLIRPTLSKRCTIETRVSLNEPLKVAG